MNDLKLSGQCADPEIVRENFNKIKRFLADMNSNVIRLQSESIDFSGLGADSGIRTWTVFMQSDTDGCNITIPYSRTFLSSVVNPNNTIWIFKGVSGASAKSVTASSGDTIEGLASLTIANDQTVFIQSNGEEYKILLDTTAMISGSGDTSGERFGIEDNIGAEDRTFNSIGQFYERYTNVIDDELLEFIRRSNDFAAYANKGNLVSSYELDSTLSSITAARNTVNPAVAVMSVGVDGVDLDTSEINARIAVDDYIKLHNYSNSNVYDKTTSDLTNKDLLVIDNTDIADGESGKIYRYTMLDIASDFADDAAAAAGSVAVGSLYHTSGAVKIRLS